MKVLIHSYNFYPMVGGIETVSETLAHHFVKMGIKCTIVTQTASEEDDTKFDFPVVRNPSFFQKLSLARNHDLIFSNGNSFPMLPFAFLAGKPFCWSHQTYELVSIDSLGWHNGKSTPLSPLRSFLFYLKLGRLKTAFKGLIKLKVKRLLAVHYVKSNVAITEWVANRIQMPRQIVIYNPFPLTRFKLVNELAQEKQFDFIFLGRLVSEKGVDILLKAFALLVNDHIKYQDLKLGLIGDGPFREHLDVMAKTLNIHDKVTFLGSKKGSELLMAVSKGQIAVIPSSWEEPMGGVALELMAAGRNIIVSKRGGLAELVGNAGLTFDNGSIYDLKNKMKLLLEDGELRTIHLSNAKAQIERYNESKFVNEYVKLFNTILSTK